MSDLDRVLDTIDADLDNALERLFVTLRLKSISTDPAYAAETRACAEWHAADLRVDRLRRRRCATPLGTRWSSATSGAATAPRCCSMATMTCSRSIRSSSGRTTRSTRRSSPAPDGTKMLVGRGTADDKGQLMTFVEACRAWKTVTGKLPLPVTVLLEGEEEFGRRQPAAVPRGQQGGARAPTSR